MGAYGTPFDDPRTTLGDTHMMTELRVEPRIGKLVELLVRAHAQPLDLARGVLRARADVAHVEDYTGTWFGPRRGWWSRPSRGSGSRAAASCSPPAGDDARRRRRRDGAPQGAPYIDEQHPYLFGAGYVLGEVAPGPGCASWRARAPTSTPPSGPSLVPRAAVIFKPTTGGVLKVMGGRAFRAPSVYEQFYHYRLREAADDAKLGEKLGPESIYSGEVEYSQRFIEDWVALVAGYTGYVEGLIEPVTDHPTLTALRQQPEPGAPRRRRRGDPARVPARVDARRVLLATSARSDIGPVTADRPRQRARAPGRLPRRRPA